MERFRKASFIRQVSHVEEIASPGDGNEKEIGPNAKEMVTGAKGRFLFKIF
jgi:hypothetical protein